MWRVQEQSMGGCQIDAGNVAARQAEEREADARGLTRFEEVCGQGGHAREEMIVSYEQGREYPLPCFARPLQLGR